LDDIARRIIDGEGDDDDDDEVVTPRRSRNVLRREGESTPREEDDENVVVLLVLCGEMGETIDVVTNASPGAEHSTIGTREMTRRNPMVGGWVREIFSAGQPTTLNTNTE
jgi:hypothetical protein